MACITHYASLHASIHVWLLLCEAINVYRIVHALLVATVLVTRMFGIVLSTDPPSLLAFTTVQIIVALVCPFPQKPSGYFSQQPPTNREYPTTQIRQHFLVCLHRSQRQSLKLLAVKYILNMDLWILGLKTKGFSRHEQFHDRWWEQPWCVTMTIKTFPIVSLIHPNSFPPFLAPCLHHSLPPFITPSPFFISFFLLIPSCPPFFPHKVVWKGSTVAST